MGRPTYKIIGAYDSETTNYTCNGVVKAFPILHQLGLLDDTPIEQITADNVEQHTDIELYRHTLDLYARLDQLANNVYDYVPVIVCHNLSFDMYGLSSWLSRHNTRVLAKSARKPITFTIRDDENNPRLVIWDTLVFAQQSLERMGVDCGYSKAVGEWDYSLIRTPQTELTPDELDYAQKDVYALLAWLGWWLQRNPDIQPEKLALNVVTKTGVVRERRKVRFQSIKGQKLKQNIGRYWMYLNREQAPKTDDELYTMQAATRGGFTFCSSVNASVPFSNLARDNRRVYAFDATSMHPAQMVSHKYPVDFHETSPKLLDLKFSVVSKCSIERMLERWQRPFPVAFYACFEFENLRPKAGSIWQKYGILPLASARYKSIEQLAQDEENGDKAAQDANRIAYGYVDTVENAVCEFGKLVSADKAQLYITELTAWEICQCYDFDSVHAVHGYSAGRFARPPDMATVSVMQFYKAKNEYKHARGQYKDTGTITNGDALKNLGVAPAIVDSMENGTLSDVDLDATYLSLKADLNALFGIEASNEYRRDTVLDDSGISFQGDFGICNKPKNPKAWYQFGQRIVGWSRIAQIVALTLISPYIHTCINGDTDSIKVLADCNQLDNIEKALDVLGVSIDKAKKDVCARVRAAYPSLYDPLENIGHYVFEFESDCFCASWNKAYCTVEKDRNGIEHYAFTLAGIPTRTRQSANSCFIGVNGYADRLAKMGYSFSDICNLLLGYNVTLAHDVIRMNGRNFPSWGETFFGRVTDYKGDTYTVSEPAALALYPMSKTINDTSTYENAVNCRIAERNNPDINKENVIVTARGVIDAKEILPL